MLNFHLPSVVLREAWPVTSPDTIRDVVVQTIGELEQFVDAEDQVQRGLDEGRGAESARRMALRLCTMELICEARLESGIYPLPPVFARPGFNWGRQYIEAIHRYRIQAAARLANALGVSPGARDVDA